MSTFHLKQLQPSTGYSLIYELHQSILFRYGKIVKKKKRKKKTKLRQHIAL